MSRLLNTGPNDFFMVDRYKLILGEDFSSGFDKNLHSIRTNTLKITENRMKEILESRGYEFEEIPWARGGYWIRFDGSLSNTVENRLGYFSMQNASSMIPPLALEPNGHDIVLDMSASPGSKTTQMAAMMRNGGLIIANDVDYDRLKALRGNLQRCGVMNTLVARNRGENIWKSGVKFSKILLDCPCTGTGTMNPRILKETNSGTINRFCSIQKRLLESAVKCLDENGTIVYSTCSLEPEENELVIDFGVRELGLKTEKISLALPSSYAREPVMEWDGNKISDDVRHGTRIIPTEKTEGFFVCKLRV